MESMPRFEAPEEERRRAERSPDRFVWTTTGRVRRVTCLDGGDGLEALSRLLARASEEFKRREPGGEEGTPPFIG